MLQHAHHVLDRIARRLAALVNDGSGGVSTARLEHIQPELLAFARHLAQIRAAEALAVWGQRHGTHEVALARTYEALACADLCRWTRFNETALGLDPTDPPFSRFEDRAIEELLGTPALSALGKAILERDVEPAGALGLDELHRQIQREFQTFADKEVAPVAEHSHRHDALIPEPLLRAMAKLGVFGISIPEDYGGSFVGHKAMILATEELSRASLGAGGSVITRPEICAKAILKGGSDAQKQAWLPAIAEGRKLVSVAVTEPDAGSDVARLKATARKVDGGYVLNGEKTWCTFAGRADWLCLLARTGTPQDGHRGLTLFLVEKPSRTSEDHARGDGGEHAFQYTATSPAGLVGTMTGNAIPTIGYRGMHSFSIGLEDWFVPDDHRIGAEGQGFYLQMEGFAGGRIQTAARAVGVMEAAFRSALSYVKDRQVFGKPLASLPLTQVKVAEMAARLQAARQLAYAVGDLMDAGEGQFEASLVKLLSCKDAEWVTREAMQLHGGMGYSEEYLVSRLWQDARVLSIFEGAEEVLGLLVIGRQRLAEVLK